MSEQDVHYWPSADILVSYDAKRNEIHYTAISTGVVLLVVDLNELPAVVRHGYRECHC